MTLFTVEKTGYNGLRAIAEDGGDRIQNGSRSLKFSPSLRVRSSGFRGILWLLPVHRQHDIYDDAVSRQDCRLYVLQRVSKMR